jgi:hypothetical protein
MSRREVAARYTVRWAFLAFHEGSDPYGIALLVRHHAAHSLEPYAGGSALGPPEDCKRVH